VAHLNTLAPRTTWHDALPRILAHWRAGKPDTWTRSYRPFGPYDYQELPTSPAVHVMWRDAGADRLPPLIAAARAAGWHIFGGGLVDTPGGARDEYLAIIVLERGATEDDLHGFTSWIQAQVGLALAAIPRLGTEVYLPSGEAAT